MMSWYGSTEISAETVRKMRAKCKEYQRVFAKRFDVSKRTIIRWEKDGAEFHRWDERRAKPWKKLLKKYPRQFTKTERESIRG